jgi:hypothetical protein
VRDIISDDERARISANGMGGAPRATPAVTNAANMAVTCAV